MYTKLTKIERLEDGKEVVTCVNFGTERCQIHNQVSNCFTCPMFGAILNQLHAFEEIIDEK